LDNEKTAGSIATDDKEKRKLAEQCDMWTPEEGLP
jgi:hypothetical protein